MNQFGQHLKQLREQRGLSLRQLEARAHVSRTVISELERGIIRPTGETARALDKALHASDRLTAHLTAATVADFTDPADDDALAAVARPRSVDQSTLDALATVLAGQRRADDSIGSSALIVPVTAQLTLVENLAAEARGPIRPAAVSLASQWAQFAGWLHTASGNWGEARGWFRRSLELASEVNDRDMIATVLSYEGHVAWLTGQVAPVIGLSQAARRDASVYVGQRAYDAFQEARGHAAVGDRDTALRVLAEADGLAEEAGRWDGEVPPWQYYRAPWFWELERGLIHRFLAREDPAAAARAVRHLAAGVDGMPAEWQASEWAGEYLVHLARAQAQAGDMAAAQVTLGRARAAVAATSAPRVGQMVERLAARLSAVR